MPTEVGMLALHQRIDGVLEAFGGRDGLPGILRRLEENRAVQRRGSPGPTRSVPLWMAEPASTGACTKADEILAGNSLNHALENGRADPAGVTDHSYDCPGRRSRSAPHAVQPELGLAYPFRQFKALASMSPSFIPHPEKRIAIGGGPGSFSRRV
ncbi:MAG: hypothetical protein MZV70_41860 [Desulfobacterales bacterium]|nr:hypothetical protein [Desulfobacterales bacterium]